MRFMILVKATADSEAGKPPSPALLAVMMKYNQELAEAGVLLAAEGLHPSAKGARIAFSGATRTVVDGPFDDIAGLVAGFWLFQVQSKDEAIQWVKRCPNPFDGPCEIEIRQVFAAEDFGSELTPELKAAETRLRMRLATTA